MTIIKNGREKKFYARCAECATEIEYEYSDVCTEKSAATGEMSRTIKCPICGKVLSVTLRSKEEIDNGIGGFLGLSQAN